MYNIQPDLRHNIVRYYLENGQSLRKTAREFNVHYQSLFKWVKWYKEEGEERLLSTYRRPWNRCAKELEEKISLLKEKDPTLTVRKAKKILEKEGIYISIKGIWGIWKRYGYAGYGRENMWNDFVEYIPWSKEAKKKFRQAKEIFTLGELKRAAEILNSIPCLPTNDLILEIPETFLSLRRRIEKLSHLSQKIPLPLYLKKIRKLYKKCTKQHLNYSALRVGIMEVMALEWSTQPDDKLRKIEELKRIIHRGGGYYSSLLFEPYFTLLISEGIAHTLFLKIEKAQAIAGTCRKLLKRKKQLSPYFMADLGALYANLEDYREAEYWLKKACSNTDEDTKRQLKLQLAYISLCKGKFREATNLSKNPRLIAWASPSWKNLFLSQLLLMKGRPRKSISLSMESLSLLKKERLNTGLFGAYFTTASAFCSIGEKAKARKLLVEGLHFYRMKKFEKYISILEILISQTPTTKIRESFPSTKLASLLRNSEYWKAFLYAKKKYLVSYLFRFIFFFPEIITDLLEKGKPTGLPKAMLKLPVFNKEIPVYDIRFLGNLIVYKNQRPLRIKLQPQDRAFLIHLALRAEEPEREISLENLCKNFWKNAKNPSRNLSHLLVRIRKAINLPPHLLEVSYRKDNAVLINRGIHFITDYDGFRLSLVKAKAFLRTSEWGFAKREYLQAFKLFRGEPFRKMYDDWSDDKRLEILFSYETEVLAFVKELKKRGRKEEAEKLLKRAEKIIPDLRQG